MQLRLLILAGERASRRQALLGVHINRNEVFCHEEPSKRPRATQAPLLITSVRSDDDDFDDQQEPGVLMNNENSSTNITIHGVPAL
jgi:hypothetical protein